MSHRIQAADAQVRGRRFRQILTLTVQVRCKGPAVRASPSGARPASTSMSTKWVSFRDPSGHSGESTMPRVFWTPARDRTLREKYAFLGPTPTASLLGTSRRSVINRAHRLGLKAPYPKDRAKPSFPPKSWSSAEKLLANALLDLLRSPS